MKKKIRSLQKAYFYCGSLFLISVPARNFYRIFAIPNPQLLRLSRTLGVTLLTFVAVGLGMTAAYGRFDIGRRKSKPIIYSLGLATIITDVVTYIQLSVMNTNPANNTSLKFENIGLLFCGYFDSNCRHCHYDICWKLFFIFGLTGRRLAVLLHLLRSL